MSQRNIFIVNAYQVDGQGNYSKLNGYPMAFDSASYGNNIDTALKRATGAFASAWSNFCNVDGKQVQTVTLDEISGAHIDQKTVGKIADVEDPAPEEPEGEGT